MSRDQRWCEVAPPQVPEGWELVYADEEGRFACPNSERDFEGDDESVGGA